ncbi:MAG: complex I subunit 4 family protein [Solirubrobacteraceae bacterium]
MPPLSILIWLPAACGVLGVLVGAAGASRRAAGGGSDGEEQGGSARAGWSVPGVICLLGSLAALGLAIGYIAEYKPGGGLQHVTDIVWIATLGIHYKLAVTGLNVFLLGLTTLLFAAAVLATNLRSHSSAVDRPRLFYFNFMLAESAVLGAFLAQDIALFVAFFDLMLIPFYFLIGSWGEGRDRVKATLKLVVYTLVGSLLMLAATVATGVLAAQQGGGHITFVLSALQGLPLSTGAQEWIFLFFAAAFLVKMPAFPLHGWMPDGYTAMPMEVLVVFSSVLSKVGAYGFLAIVLPLFPRAAVHFQTLMLLIALASIVYGSIQAFSQTNARMILAYSSMAQLGFITLGIFALNPQGAQGALLQMLNHGLVMAAGLFIVAVLARRAGGSEDIRDMGGIALRAPVLVTIFLIVSLATLAMPGSANFVGEFLILLGAFKAKLVIAIIAFSGVIMASVYALRLFIRAMHNRVGANAQPREISIRDGAVLVPLVLVIVFMALYPQLALRRSESSAKAAVASTSTALHPPAAVASTPGATTGEPAEASTGEVPEGGASEAAEAATGESAEGSER